MKYVAVSLSALRGILALASLLAALVWSNWFVALVLLLAAVLTDPYDGQFAKWYPVPEGSKLRRYGKIINETASGILSWTAPLTPIIWLFIHHPDSESLWHSGWFWSWIGIGVIFVLGTLWFNSLRSVKNHRGNLAMRLRATVIQGWFFGLILFVCAIQMAYLSSAPGTFAHNLCVVLLVTVILIGVSRHRWTARPEVVAEHEEYLQRSGLATRAASSTGGIEG